MELQNDLILRTARGEKTERPPVWLMRQAGRILPQYRAVRASVSGFIELAKTPELAAEVTIQPVDILDVDAAIIFSDILVIPEAMGFPYEMIEKKGPFFPNTINSEADLNKIIDAEPEDLRYVLDAITITKKELNGRVPLIGFAGAPWTILAYMVEGQGSKTFSKARKLLYTNPSLAHKVLEKITASTIKYLKAQIAHGANMVQVFDSWAGILPHDQYLEFSLKYINVICDEINEVPVTVFAKGAHSSLKEQAALNCNTLGVDWNTQPQIAREIIGTNKTLQGNLDPCALYADEDKLVHLTQNMLNEFGKYKHIVNLGHGVYPDTDPEKVKIFIKTVKNFTYK